MKRSKIFLGATAFVLGIAAFAAHKAKSTAHAFRFKKAPLPACAEYGTTGVPVTINNPGNEPVLLGTVAGTFIQYSLYTQQISSTTCGHPLYFISTE